MGLSVSRDHRGAGRSPGGDRRTSFRSCPAVPSLPCGLGPGSVPLGLPHRLPLMHLQSLGGRFYPYYSFLPGSCWMRAVQSPNNIHCLTMCRPLC